MLVLFDLLSQELLEKIYETECNKIQQIKEKIYNLTQKAVYSFFGLGTLALLLRDNVLLTLENTALLEELEDLYNYTEFLGDTLGKCQHEVSHLSIINQYLKFLNSKKRQEYRLYFF